MQRTDSTTSSTATLRDSDYNADEALRRVRQLTPRPKPPAQTLHAVPLPHDIVTQLDELLANPVVPVDADGWTHYERADDEDPNSPVIPKLPRPRRPVDEYTPVSGYGSIWAHQAFGSAA